MHHSVLGLDEWVYIMGWVTPFLSIEVEQAEIRVFDLSWCSIKVAVVSLQNHHVRIEASLG